MNPVTTMGALPMRSPDTPAQDSIDSQALSSSPTPSVSNLNQRAFRLTTISPNIALREAQTALRRAIEEKNPQEEARAYSTIGVVLRYQDRYDSALIYHHRARTIFEQIGDTTGFVDALLNIAGVYQSRGDYTGVMDNCFQALALSEKRGEKRGISRSYASIGIGYVLKNDFAQALNYQRKALKLRTEIDDKQAVAHSWRNMGMIFERMNLLDSALYYYTQSLAQFDRVGDIQGVALAMGSLGSRYERAGDSKKAREYHFKVIPLYEQLGDRRGLAVVHNSLASGFLRQKNYSEALRYGERALAIATSIGAVVEERDAAKHISDAYSAIGNEGLGFAFFRRYVALKDSLTNLQNTRRMEELQSRYDLARKDRELVEAEHQRQVESLSANNLRQWLIFASIVFVIVLGLVANGYRIKRRSEQVLRQQNEEIVYQQERLREQSEEIRRTNADLQTVNALLGEQNTELTQLNIEKNEFLGIAAHDLKNPLSNILLTVQLIDEYHLSAPAEKLQEWTRSINRGAEYMLNIIGNLLDINKIEAGKVAMTLEPIDASLVELITEAYTYRASEKGIHLHYQAPKTKLTFYADRNALQQVLENLISNALKFSPHGHNVYVGVKPTAGDSSLVIGDSSSGNSPHPPQVTNAPMTNDSMTNNFLRIEIQDEGEGISPDDMKKLFGKFVRLSARPTGGEHSTGLGLSIVKKMVEAMNGRVWCESEVGKGATFIVELPSAA